MKAVDVKYVIGAFDAARHVYVAHARAILDRECEHDETFESKANRVWAVLCVGCGKGMVRRDQAEVPA